MKKADKRPVGEAQDEPNRDPVRGAPWAMQRSAGQREHIQKPRARARPRARADPAAAAPFAQVLPLPDRAKLNLFDPMGSLMTIIGPERLKQALAIIIATLVFLIVGGMGFVILNDYISAEIMKAVGGNRGR